MDNGERVREIAAALVNNGRATAIGAAKWNSEQSTAAHNERETLTAELVALIKGGQ